MAEDQPVSVGEFTRTVDRVERQIAAGFRGVHARLSDIAGANQINGERLAAVEATQADCAGHESRLTVLETLRAQEADQTKRDARAEAKKSSWTWGSITAGGVTGALWVADQLYKYFTSGGQ